METVLVSAFIYLKQFSFKSLELYITNGKKLISQPVKKVIFMDSNLINYFDKEYELTTIIPINFNDLYLSKYKNVKINVSSTNPSKDTLDYFIIICNKTEWMREAIELFPDNSQFMWVDFGIFYIFNDQIPNFTKINNYPNVRIASIWNVYNQYIDLDITKHIHWYFCGGVFGGDKKSLIKFADLVKEKCIKIIKNSNLLMWEANIWYLVWLENKNLFDPYYVNTHGIDMINKY